MEKHSTGKKIKIARMQAGMTQAQLAKQIGTTSQNISQYERDIRKPKYETLQKIAKALEVDWLSLFSADSVMELQEAQTVELFTRCDNCTVEEAQEIFWDTVKKDELHSTIRDNLKLLNSAGLLAAGQLILSVAERRSLIEHQDSNYWMTLIIESCFGSSEETLEVKKGIDLLLKIPAYQKNTDPTQK